MQTLMNTLKGGILALTVVLSTMTGLVNKANAQTIKNVVLVHGAFADGSGWRALYDILTKKGFHVSIVQNPLTSLEDDVAATKVVLDNQDGPTILVGHSWGGAVITEAGNHPKVAALVYVAAFQPDNGESALQWLQTAPPAPKTVYYLRMQKVLCITTRQNIMQDSVLTFQRTWPTSCMLHRAPSMQKGLSRPSPMQHGEISLHSPALRQKTRALIQISSVPCTNAPTPKR